jgi:large subunit GTPase 1
MPGHGGKRTTQKPTGIGNAILNDRQRQKEKQGAVRANGVAARQANRSVLEQDGLDDFLASAELGQASFESNRGEQFSLVEAPRLVSAVVPTNRSAADVEAAAKRAQVPIPRRPQWNTQMSAEQLETLEGESFLEWRRGLARWEEQEGFVMTPYEKNLDFWRQLWRCVERSDLLVQILDSRDPDFYFSRDLFRYVEEVGSTQMKTNPGVEELNQPSSKRHLLY